MNVLELFSGSRSIGKVAEQLGHKVYSVDNVDYPNTDYVGDILDWKQDLLCYNETPDMIWASCPCTDFSVACIGRKWVSGHEYKPRDPNLIGIKLLNTTIEIIKYYQRANPDLIWFVENPRGKMRKSPIWETIEHQRHTVFYCKFGDTRMKPTDIWTNQEYFNAGEKCKNYRYDEDGNVIDRHCHHETSQRGETVKRLRQKGIMAKKGGTEVLKDNHERSKIPHKLCEHIFNNLNNKDEQRIFTKSQQLQIRSFRL
mgnify:FL=1|tara:strand:+ start:11717 stop:12484 length:768 start_codon:yes stop_codon:yes gene_type:complete